MLYQKIFLMFIDIINFVKASRDCDLPPTSPISLTGRKKQSMEAAKMVLASLKLLGASQDSESRGAES